ISGRPMYRSGRRPCPTRRARRRGCAWSWPAAWSTPCPACRMRWKPCSTPSFGRTCAGEAATLVSRVLRTAGLWESAAAEALTAEVDRLEAAGNPTLAFLASGGQVRVRITAKAASPDAARALIAPVEERVRAALGPAVYGADGDTLAGVVHRLLLARDETVAVAESLTGGLLGAALTDEPGASVTFRGGII